MAYKSEFFELAKMKLNFIESDDLAYRLINEGENPMETPLSDIDLASDYVRRISKDKFKEFEKEVIKCYKKFAKCGW